MNYIKLFEEFKSNYDKDLAFQLLNNCIAGKYYINEKDVNTERSHDNLLNYEIFFSVYFYDGLITQRNIELDVMVNYTSKDRKFDPEFFSLSFYDEENGPNLDNMIIEAESIKSSEKEFILNFLNDNFDIYNMKIERTKSPLDILAKPKLDIDPNMN